MYQHIIHVVHRHPTRILGHQHHRLNHPCILSLLCNSLPSPVFLCQTSSPIRVQEQRRIGRVEPKKHRLVRTPSCTIRTRAVPLVYPSFGCILALFLVLAREHCPYISYPMHPAFPFRAPIPDRFTRRLVSPLIQSNLTAAFVHILFFTFIVNFFLVRVRSLCNHRSRRALCHIHRLVAFFRTISSMLQHRTIPTIICRSLGLKGPPHRTVLHTPVVYITKPIVHRSDIILH